MPSELDERMQRQALADQKRKLMKELQEREKALEKQESTSTPSHENKEAAGKKY